MTSPVFRIAVLARSLPAESACGLGGSLALRAALVMVEAGHSVTLCGVRASGGETDVLDLRDALAATGIEPVCLHVQESSPLRDSLVVLDWLRTQDAALAVFVDCEEVAYWAGLARRTRTGLPGTPVAVLVHDSTAASLERAGRFIGGPADMLLFDVQSHALANADCVVTLNTLAAARVEGLGVAISAALVCPPLAYLARPAPAGIEWPLPALQRRLAVCGTISAGTGLRQTLAALDNLLEAWPADLDRCILFVGRWGQMPNNESAPILIERRLAYSGVACLWADTDAYLRDVQSGATRADVAIFSDPTPDAFDALAALAAAGALSAVTGDTVYAHLFEGESEAILCTGGASGLADAARHRRAPVPVRDAIGKRAALAVSHLREVLLAAAGAEHLQPFAGGADPKVTVCISHFDRPHLLDQAIRSLEAQTYHNLEVVIVDDASPGAAARAYIAALPDRFAPRGWQVIRNETEQWQQTSRNIAARAAGGDYILIMDDDNCARPDEVATLVAVAQGLGAQVVRCLQSNFTGEAYPDQVSGLDSVDFFPTGGPLAVGTMWNVFGDVNVLYERETFLRLGGFSATDGLGCEDFEIGIRCAKAGVAAVTVPRVLYDYRLSPLNMAKTMSNKRLYDSHARLAALFEADVPTAIAPVFRLLNENFHRVWQRDGHAYWTRLVAPPGSFRRRALGTSALQAEALYLLAGMLVEEGALDDAATIIERLALDFSGDQRIPALRHDLLVQRGRFEAARRFGASLEGSLREEDARKVREFDAVSRHTTSA